MLDDFDDPTDKLVPLDQCIDENDAYVDESGEIEALPWADRPTISPAEISDRRKQLKKLTGTYLTPMEELFVAEYCVDKHQTQAAIRAGFSEKTAVVKASQLMHQERIQIRIKQQLAKLNKKVFKDAEVILKDIYDIGTRCMQKEPVLDEKGQPIGEWKFDSQGALRSRELLGKHLELFTDKVKQQGETVLNIVVHKNDQGKLEKHNE